MIFRTEEQKSDLIRSWNRPDRPFFASGACHVLASAFLETRPNAGFRPFLILPEPGLRGSHVFVSDGKIAFDYHGFSKHEHFLSHYFAKISRFFPLWNCDVIDLKESPTSVSFCETYNHRLPSQYLHDPMPRAFAYLARFPLVPRVPLGTQLSAQLRCLPPTSSPLCSPPRETAFLTPSFPESLWERIVRATPSLSPPLHFRTLD